MSVLFLMETFCLPLLRYSCEALSCSKQQLNQLNICWNRAYRKVFKMNDWESFILNLSVGAAWIAGQDRSMWRTLRPSAGQAQQ